MSSIPIRVITRNFNLLTEIKQYQSLLFTRSWNGVGQLTLIINRYTPGTEHLQKGHILFPHNQLHKAYMIRHRDWGVTTNARVTEVTEIYEHGNVRIEPVFGYSRPTLIDKIKEIKR